ncbi:hypothetical protein DL93DRAFT_2038978, partial [Clavulina sp. PMI_390]
IRKFVAEYARTLYKCLATLVKAGVTASGTKLVLATREVEIVGHTCSLQGIRPRHGAITKILNWPIPQSITQV